MVSYYVVYYHLLLAEKVMVQWQRCAEKLSLRAYDAVPLKRNWSTLYCSEVSILSLN